jgi:hypothetical protein
MPKRINLVMTEDTIRAIASPENHRERLKQGAIRVDTEEKRQRRTGRKVKSTPSRTIRQ